jgi:lantibiotic modifying enzyme
MTDVHPLRPLSPADTGRGWQPLLDGDQYAQTLVAVQKIAVAVRPPQADAPWPFRKTATNRLTATASLFDGTAGLALFHAYLARALPELEADGHAARFLEHAMDQVAAVPMPPGLYEGLTGVAWTVAHLQEQTAAADEEDPLADVDALLLEHIDHAPGDGDYDLISGLVGYGVYALERLPSLTAAELLTRVVVRLAERAVHSSDGITWFTHPRLFSPQQRALFPGGYYNLGLAHGVPGVIALLGLACQAGVASHTARSLLTGAVSWLLTQMLPPDSPSAFGPFTGPGVHSTPARLAWCYGDPGVAAALLLAARCAREEAWERAALEIARKAARRAPAGAGVTDAGLCHGAAGLGHLFHRLFRATGDDLLGETARFWFGQALTYRLDPAEDPGFLTGAAGTGLAFLAAISHVEPLWDRTLLISVPPRS